MKIINLVKVHTYITLSYYIQEVSNWTLMSLNLKIITNDECKINYKWFEWHQSL